MINQNKHSIIHASFFLKSIGKKASAFLGHASGHFVQNRYSRLFCIVILFPLISTGINAEVEDDFSVLRFNGWEGYLQFQTTYEGLDNEGYSQERQIYEQELFLKNSGSFYHPNLFDFTLEGRIGYTYERYKRDNLKDSDDGYLLGYGFRGNILKKKPYGFTIYANETQRWATRPFLPSYRLKSTEHGLRWQVSTPLMSSRFEVSESSNYYENYDAITLRDRTVDEFQIQYEIEVNLNEYNTVDFDFEYLESDDSYLLTVTETTSAQLGHVLVFGENRADKLISRYQYYLQKGQTEYERNIFSERLHLQHTENLLSRYSYRHEVYNNRSATTDNETTIDSGDASIQHKLYRSLVSRLGVRFQERRLRDQSVINTFGYSASFNYTKRNRWGRLNSSYSYDYQKENTDLETADVVTVLDESQTFNDPLPVILSAPNINTATIVITNLANTLTYIEGIDYNVLDLGTRVEISRIAIGNILNGETVLIDYEYSPLVESETESTTNNFTIGQYFKSGAYVSYSYLNREYSSSPPTSFIQSDSDTHTYILGYRLRKLSARVEYQTEDSDYSYESYRAHFSYGIQLTNVLNSSFAAGWTHTEYDDNLSRDLEYYNFTWYNYYLITKNLDAEASLTYREEQDTLYGDSEGLDFRAGLKWNYRKTSLRISYYSTSYDSTNLDSRTSELRLTLRRTF